MYCPECGKQIQNGSKFCQHCGFKLSVFTDNEIKLKTKKKNNKNKDNMAVSIFVLVIVIILLVSIFYIIIISIKNESSSKSIFNDVDAFTVAESIVRDQLLSPSTAKFCKITEATCAYDSAKDRWTVSGWVDSQNAYGAMIRQHWTAIFQPVKDSKGNIGCEHGTVEFY